jgi:hypothetical protein
MDRQTPKRYKTSALVYKCRGFVEVKTGPQGAGFEVGTPSGVQITPLSAFFSHFVSM